MPCPYDVGYETICPSNGIKNILGVQFQNTTGGDLDVQNIKCMNGASNPTDNAFKMWWYDRADRAYKYAIYTKNAYADDGQNKGWGTKYTDKFYWCTDDDDTYILAPKGWKHDPDATPTLEDHSKTIEAGEGFWVQPAASQKNAKLQFKNPFHSAE